MKIGILTQPLLNNYGGLLQNYALQQVLIRAGHKVETMNWKRSLPIRAKLYCVKLSFASKLCPNKFQPQKYTPSDKEQALIRKNINRFIDNYIHHTVAVKSLEGFAKQAKIGKYDGYVVGSDQCWRPKYNSFMPAMFLSFVQYKDVKRIAYAASFGTDEWEFTPKMAALCAPLAQKFDIVTVREDSGIRLCKEYLGIEAIHVLDPTMLLTKEDYIHLIEEEQEPNVAGTLFHYILDPDDKITAFINRVAKGLDFKPFQVLPKYQQEIRTKEDIKKRIEDCVFPGVTAWLRAFMDAEMIIVDSFHGMVFSILFNKPFWVIGNADRGMSRFTSLLKIFGLEDRLLDLDDLDKVDYTRSIEWDNVNRILELNREKSKRILLDAFK